MRPRYAAVAPALALVVCACAAADPSETQAVTAARTFSELARSDPTVACALLAPRARDDTAKDSPSCAVGLRKAGLPSWVPPESVEVAGHSAQVRDSAGAVVYLALLDAGWRVTAAGCHRVAIDPSVPYDCDVSGA
jgi:hypothetical protein